jgi:hypothetical protein
MKITHVKVLTPSKRKKKNTYHVLHDNPIFPPCSDKQLTAAFRQQYFIDSLHLDDGVATYRVKELTTDEAA